jgi:hypothetical protein
MAQFRLVSALALVTLVMGCGGKSPTGPTGAAGDWPGHHRRRRRSHGRLNQLHRRGDVRRWHVANGQRDLEQQQSGSGHGGRQRPARGSNSRVDKPDGLGRRPDRV